MGHLIKNNNKLTQKENKEIKVDFILKTHIEQITFNTFLRKAIILENVLKFYSLKKNANQNLICKFAKHF